MKKIWFIVAAICLALGNASAQGFEGTLKWKMNIDIDFLLKSPEVKKTIEQMGAVADPKSPEVAQFVQMMMPQGFEIKLKEGNTIFALKGGMAAAMAGEMLYRKDKNQTYNLDRARATYSLVNPKDKKPLEKVTLKKTKEKAVIAGLNCVQYNVKSQIDGKSIEQKIWTTTDIKDIDKELIKQLNAGQTDASLFFEGMEGVPMKLEVPEMGISMEVVEVKREKLNASDFVVPANFKDVSKQ